MAASVALVAYAQSGCDGDDSKEPGGSAASGGSSAGGSAGNSATGGTSATGTGGSGIGGEPGGAAGEGGADEGGASGGADAGESGAGGGGMGGGPLAGRGGASGSGGKAGGAGSGGAAGGPSGSACGRSESAALVLGQTDFASKTPASGTTGMTGPFGSAVDPTSGKIFVADYVNNRVLRFAARSSLANGAAAEAVLGQADFTSSDISATPSRMDNPVSVAVDGAGRLWVADQGHNRVLRFDAAAGKANGAAADGVLGQANFTDAVRGLGAAGLDAPTAVVADGAGRLFVADSINHRVLRFDAAAGKANGAAADGVLGQANFDDRGQATTQSGLFSPHGLALDSAGRLWVGDQGNARVVRFDSAATKANGGPADAVLGQANFTDRLQQAQRDGMFRPTGVTIDPGGTLWVADFGHHRVLCFSSAATKPSGSPADGILGQTTFTDISTGTAANRFNAPIGISSDGAGNLMVADYENHRVLFFAP